MCAHFVCVNTARYIFCRTHKVQRLLWRNPGACIQIRCLSRCSRVYVGSSAGSYHSSAAGNEESIIVLFYTGFINSVTISAGIYEHLLALASERSEQRTANSVVAGQQDRNVLFGQIVHSHGMGDEKPVLHNQPLVNPSVVEQVNFGCTKISEQYVLFPRKRPRELLGESYRLHGAPWKLAQ